MCSPGNYMLGGVEVELLPDQRVVLRRSADSGKPRLAGSALRMDHAIANVMRIARVSLLEAIAMATINAARAGRVPGRLRGIRPGERADLVRFTINDGRIHVRETYLSGTLVYSG
jgi:N-acetylglucosamine-6-phosphate deacetylase